MSRKTAPDVAAWVATLSVALLAGCKGGGAAASSGESPPSVGTAGNSAGQVEKAGDCCMSRNPCKGQGGCAVPESHACAGKNECKGKGGCNMHCPK